MILLLLSLLLPSPFSQAFEANYGFSPAQCKEFSVTKADGEGVLRHCDNGKDQLVYLSGELDPGPKEPNNRDLEALRSAAKLMKKRKSGRFFLVTNNATGGDVDWHAELISAVEDSCLAGCRIQTEVRGSCLSACNQLHLTCVKGASSTIQKGAKMCDHATVGDADDEKCDECDPKPPHKCNICGPKESIKEYTDRCDPDSFEERGLELDGERRKAVKKFAKTLAKMGAFGTSTWTCLTPPWVKAALRP